MDLRTNWSHIPMALIDLVSKENLSNPDWEEVQYTTPKGNTIIAAHVKLDGGNRVDFFCQDYD